MECSSYEKLQYFGECRVETFKLDGKLVKANCFGALTELYTHI